ncbi:MAG: AmmeMemoRadiSam system protein B [Candidatus Omnitrophota bacterium]|nr:MAG: AmmeMemoRadiSam system protein B [Candidatus Omnitrophota bacterium]
MIREPEVAGQFYPATPAALKKVLEHLVEKKGKKEQALGLLSPHAGYVFSGQVAGIGFSKVKLTDTVIILGPNHTGRGAPFSIMTEGTWHMPMGNVEVDSELAKNILEESKYLEEDVEAHIYEHSIEVQLPFLQFLLPKIKILPIVLSAADFMIYEEIGKAIAKTLKANKKNCLIIASSDMTHHEPRKKAEEDDKLAIEAMLKLDAQELLRRIQKFNITMCGYGPAVSMLCAVKELGAKTAKLIKYQTSADVTGDETSVVGYAGIMVL